MSAPLFAVVGRVNKGKSSIIATLAEDDRVAISPIPGTTRKCTEFPVVVDGQTLFTLVDTPGFEEAPRALAWLRQDEPGPEGRTARVAAFVKAYEGTSEFVEERELLAPILRGAGILYVVDGAKPYRPNYKSEMEILCWTGQPRMALVNRVGEGDHADSWRDALGQYFSVVRDFDAHRATFEERIRLLTTFRELHDPWRAPLQRAIDALLAERTRRRAEVADLITALLVEELTFTLETRHEGGLVQAGERQRLEEGFHEELRKKERRARERVEALYNHSRVAWDHGQDLERPVFERDLFAKKTWALLGLSPKQVLALYAVSGATMGGIIDVGVGGTSLLAGTALGAVVGTGVGLFHLGQRFAKATTVGGVVGRFRNAFTSGTSWRVGPHAHPNFPFVLLDRALLHYDAVRTRAHARNACQGDVPRISAEGERVTNLDKPTRDALHSLFDRIRKNHQDLPHGLREELHARIVALLAPLP